MADMTDLLLAGGFVFVCALFYLFAAMVSDPIIDAALAELDEPIPHLTPESCGCADCRGYVAQVHAREHPSKWDRALVRELEGGAA